MDNTGAGMRPPSLTQPLVSLASISTEHFRPSPLTLDWLYSLPLPPGCPVQPFPQTSEDWALVEQYRLLCQGLTVMAEYERERARRQQRGEDPDAQPWDPRTSSDPAVVFAAECLFNGPDWVESEDHASSPSEHDDAAYEPIDSPSQAADAAFLGVLSAVQQQQQRNASSSSSTTFTTSIPLSLSDLTALSSALPLSSASSQPAQSLSPSQIPADGILSDSALSPASLPSLMSAIAELEQCVARLSLEASEARRLQRRMRGAVVAASAANAGAAGEAEAEGAKKKGKNRKKKKKVAAAPASLAPPPPAVAAPPAPKQREGAGGDDSDLLNALHSVSMLDRRADEYRERLRVLKEQIHHHAAIADRLASSAVVSAPSSPAGQGTNGHVHAHVHGSVEGEAFEEYEEEEEEEEEVEVN
ncbi:hypothetical protein JCM10296v2_002712 [Rhodotorula toruloides]